MKQIITLIILLAGVSAINGQYIDPNLYTQFSFEEKVSYIVILDSSADISNAKDIKGKTEKTTYVHEQLRLHAHNTQHGIVTYLKTNDIQHHAFYVVNAIKVTSSKSIFDHIKKMPNIAQIVYDAPTQMSTYWEEKTTQTQRGPDPEWGILKINADKVWEMGYRGQGVVVAGQDTGYDWLVSPLQQKYRGYIADSLGDHNYNWHDAIHEPSVLSADSLNPCGFDVLEPCDDNNHGTHTMGTMVGSDTLNAIGVAPDAKWIACRNMERGNGSPSTYIECFEWFLAPTDLNNENPDPSKAPHVIANSWACPESEGCNPSNWAFMEAAIENLRSAGTVVVVSAGNSGSDCGSVNNPAAIFEGSFSVGATRQSDTIAGFSSRGFVTIDSSYRVKPNVSAPGQGVRSVIRDGEFRNFSGTSMAGPHVAGAVALIISANPALAGEVGLIESILEQSSVTLVTEQECGELSNYNIPNNTYGYGRIDVLKAVQLAQSMKDEFAPIGAKWVFEAIDWAGPSPLTYAYTIECIGTKNIEGKECKILTKQINTCDLTGDTTYVYQDLNRVYLYRDGAKEFFLLYDFNRVEGESYRLDNYNWYFNHSPKEFKDYNIDSISNILIDGKSFDAQFISEPFDNSTSIIIPRIGNISGLFPIEYALCDGLYTTKLRCYSDNEFNLKLTADPECEVISNVSDEDVELIKIQPNPASETINILGIPNSTPFRIVNSHGIEISKGLAAANQPIDVSYLPSGLYIISFDDMKRNLKFVKN